MKCILLILAITCFATCFAGLSDLYEFHKKVYKQEKKLYKLSLEAAERARETEYKTVRKSHLNKKDYFADILAFTHLSFDDDRLQYGGCTCDMLICTCCGKIEVAKVNLNDTACLTLEYNNTNRIISYDFNLTPSLEGYTFNNTFSVSKTESPCFTFNEEEKANVCITNYDFYTSFNDYMAQGCVEMKIRKDEDLLETIRIGCYSMYYQIGHSNFIKDVISSHSLSGETQYLSRNNPYLRFKVLFF